MNLKKRWFDLLATFTSDSLVIDKFWMELELKYNESHRAYHNLTHIQSMLILLDNSKAKWEDVTVLELSIWYHDIIYDATQKDNELQSALLAKKHLSHIGLSDLRIQQIYAQILATQTHSLANSILNKDSPYLLDLDLEVLSRDWESYKIYTQQIRVEYCMYPEFMYNRGRQQAMQRFLERPSIYHTPFFQQEKEQIARENILRELEMLGE